LSNKKTLSPPAYLFRNIVAPIIILVLVGGAASGGGGVPMLVINLNQNISIYVFNIFVKKFNPLL